MGERLLISHDFPTGWQTEGGDRERAGAARGGEAQVDVGGRGKEGGRSESERGDLFSSMVAAHGYNTGGR